jgi:SAM-dependent methyltransferase
MSAAEVIAEQRVLWSTNVADWAALAEPQNEPLYERVLELTDVGPGTRLLDLACGSGYAAALAGALGAQVAGVDIAPLLLEIARERTPQGDFRLAAMEELPFAEGSFEVVTAVNALQFSVEIDRALAEAVRVLVPGGRIAVATFAEAERNEGTALQRAMASLAQAGREDGYAPYSLSQDGALEEILAAAGLRVLSAGELELTWCYRDGETLTRALLASAGGARASRAAGEPRVREAIAAAAGPFTDADGAVSLHNVFRHVVAAKP